MEDTHESLEEKESQAVTINRTISLEERVRDLVALGDGITVEELRKMDEALVKRDEWELLELNLNKGRLYPRAKQREPGVVGVDYDYGNKLAEGERGLTPTELFSLLADGSFGDLRGVYIPGSKEGELLFLDLEENRLERHRISEAPNRATADQYAFPTIRIPSE